MKLEGNEQVERLDLIVALLTIQKTRLLYNNEQAALDKNLKELETFLFNHESDTAKLKDTINKQESVINTYLGKGTKYSIKG